MALNAPIITFPTTAEGFSTNLDTVTLAGTTDLGTVSILVNGSSGGVTFASGGTTWSFFTELVEGENLFQVRALDDSSNLTTSDDLLITKTEEVDASASPPTGIQVERFRDSVKISITENPEEDIVGYNFYGAEQPGGGDVGFTLLNNELITEPDRTEEVSVLLSETFVTDSQGVRTTTKVEQITQVRYFANTHDKNNQPLGTLPIAESNNYVVTAVAFDPILQQQVESPFSAEVSGKPLILDTEIRLLEKRERFDIKASLIDTIQQGAEEADAKPTSVVDNIFVSPDSLEFSRLYTILQFVHASHSILTLLEYDDLDDDGESDDVLTNTNKNALREALLIPEEDAQQVQELIDGAFDLLGTNTFTIRKTATNSIGKALFFFQNAPISIITIQNGSIIETNQDTATNTPAVRFEVPVGITISPEDAPQFFNSDRNRYEVSLDIVALETGETGNVDANTIVNVVSGIDGVFSVVNETATNFGTNKENNASLARRISLAFVSVDTGTEAGYLSTALAISGVQRARIEKAGDSLMLRDLDPLREIHIGGNVDVYIQGKRPREFQDVFSFKFAAVENEFAIIESTLFYKFRSTNTEVTADAPIFNVIAVRNVTKNANYDLSNLTISGDGNVIDLDESIGVNVSIGLASTDVIQISYSYRKTEPIILKNQPVDSISSIEGTDTGVLPAANFVLEKLQDPLKEGNSTIAEDQVRIIFANNIPEGNFVVVTDEEHQLIAEQETALELVGPELDTIVVQNTEKTITYVKNSDYVITDGANTASTTIRRISSGTIPDLATVLVSYTAGENFTISYSVNGLLQEVQEDIDEQKHLTADVIVKNAVETRINMDLAIVLAFGADQTTIDRKIRTNISNLFASAGLGESIPRSKIVDVIHDVVGVSKVTFPIPKVVRADSSLIVKEAINNDTVTDALETIVKSYITSSLSHPTLETGGQAGDFSMLYEDDISMTLVATENEVAQGEGRFFIRSDSRVVFSTRKSDSYLNHAYTITYNVYSEEGSQDIDVTSIEYLVLGELNITFDKASASFGGF